MVVNWGSIGRYRGLAFRIQYKNTYIIFRRSHTSFFHSIMALMFLCIPQLSESPSILTPMIPSTRFSGDFASANSTPNRHNTAPF